MTYPGGLREIAAIELSDGVAFDADSISASAIRDGDADEYAGVRVRLVGLLGRARLTVGIDVNFGDPIWPAPQLIELPRIVLLDQPPVTLLGYPLAMVLAEKIVTAIDRGEGNTRWRDFADVYSLMHLHSVEAAILRNSLETVAAYRGVTLAPVLPALAEMPERAQPKWCAWRARVNRQKELPEAFAEVLNEIARFSDPVLRETTNGIWNIAQQGWGDRNE
ncbi:nucleotidyl transferase AbiEii/AbiGii toxin family protein [Paramicrobacterium fandaimingii]|uniref:nucleotidyl transferase AbiEii/AbiGii toxin family protein n=1 Tax=Paramicrobacterium fandaimingii TaxID=2708079 RepID=UPI001AB051CB|nr:nucleotidyl transferase AbiEii/AbiGii toxin family protein [Microbacterium fandaimingii]